jgi:DNA polymerase III epsilon subunit-like protein
MTKHFYLIVDTETTAGRNSTVADFGAVLVSKQGAVIERFGAMVLGHFSKKRLFSDPTAPDSALWSEQSAQRREKDYYSMLDTGERSIVSVAGINQWLARINAQYSPVVTAYNLAFDLGKCRNTKISLGIFAQSFCLMKAAKRQIGQLAEYHNFCFENDFLTAKLRRPSMTADTMAKFILGLDLEDEPHTALEDAQFYEAPILHKILQDGVTRKQLLELGK